MDSIKFWKMLAKAGEEFQKPMTIDEAIKIVDPTSGERAPEDWSYEQAQANYIKACMVLTEYAKKKREEENVRS